MIEIKSASNKQRTEKIEEQILQKLIISMGNGHILHARR